MLKPIIKREISPHQQERKGGEGGGGRRDRLSYRRDKTYKTIGIVRPVEEDAIDGFLDCENTDRGGVVAGCDCWILCF